MPMPQVIDTVLDRLVVPGYSRLGYAVRSRTWRDVRRDALAGRTVLVTGASSGLGTATAAGLAGYGAEVEMVVRDAGRGEDARRSVLEAHPQARVTVAECDLSSIADTRRYARELVARGSAVHGVVNNAGVMPAERTETAEGHELALATHVLGPYTLTRELAPALRAGAGTHSPSRVVIVSSGGMYAAGLRTDDPEYREDGYSGTKAYARTKRMQVVLAELLADDLAAEGVVVHSMHPGWADTPGVASSMPGFHRLTSPLLRTAEQGADTAVWLVAADEPGRSTGVFWHDRTPRPTHYLPGSGDDPERRAALRRLCAAASGTG